MTSSVAPGRSATARRAPSRRSATWRIVRGPLDERDAATSVRGEMRDGEVTALDVVDGDGAEVRARHLAVDEDHRHAAALQALEQRRGRR